MLAGAKWRSGADTCVFKPAVKCKGESEVRPGVSRVRITSKSSRDLFIETRIREAFPKLVESGAVSVYSHSCVPEFTADDIATTADTYESGSGCKRLGELTPGSNESLTNLITPELGQSMQSVLTQVPTLPRTNRIQLMKRALQAAVDMVPDAGPWIVHADCHLGNVLLRGGQSVLSDWGRAVVIEDPANIESVRKGIKDWILSLDYLGVLPNAPSPRFQRAITMGLSLRREYPQHPEVVMDEIGYSVFEEEPKIQDIARQAIRGWLVYVLIAQAFDVKDKTLLKTANQAELQAKLDAFLSAPGAVVVPLPPSKGGMYWPTKYFRGLTRRQNLQRKRSATRRTKMSFKDPKAYVPFKSDTGVKTRRSSYTSRFRKRCPGATTLPQISKCTKVPTKTLRTVYNRGMAAWRTGHRPGASQHAWGMARVHSFVLKGKTYRTADKDLAEKK